MFHIKRQAKFNESLHNKTKKFRTTCNEEKDEVTSIENLSNELFYEVFEYLDGCDIFKAFCNLNNRFQHLITRSSLLFKVKLNRALQSELEYYCRNVVLPCRQRILSLYFNTESLIDGFFQHCVIDSSFQRLQSVVFNGVSIDRSIILMFYLKSLPRLLSLTIHFDAEWAAGLSHMYRLIFTLPCLKFNKLTLSLDEDDELGIFMPLAINEQFSTIEYLVINHCCTLNELYSLLRHTPQLRLLNCENLISSDMNIQTEETMTISNLKCICFTIYGISFIDFENFMSKLGAPLQVLRIKHHFGEDYIDADRWERLIRKHMLHLHTFEYEYRGFVLPEYDSIIHDVKIKQFISPFWIERQWIFDLQFSDYECVFSIRSYRKTWLDFHKYEQSITSRNEISSDHSIQHVIRPNRQDDVSSSNQFIPTVQLQIDNTLPYEPSLFIDSFKSTFVAVQFTRLSINCSGIPIAIFVNILHFLPHLDSLEVSSLSITEPDWLSYDDAINHFLTSTKNKITKVNFKKIIEMKEVHFLLYLCLRVQYFKFDVPSSMDIKMLVRFILMRADTYIPYLCLLCLHVPNANDNIVHVIQNLTDTEKLLANYIIKRVGNEILLQRKKH